MPEVRRLGRRRAVTAGGSPIRPPTPPKIKVGLGERGTAGTVRGAASRMDAGVGARRLTSRRTAAIGGVSMAKGRPRMCGVIGYTGPRDTAARLLGGLERLEYRGYDSAGICLWTADGLEFTKAVGKLENLKRKAGGRRSRSTTGIGHTRWATHGRVTEENAHPLSAGDHTDVAIVLNGIIENHAELKRTLSAHGERFSSETDAEVVAHLVKQAYAGDLVAAVQAACVQLEGHFAFIAVHRDHPDLLVGTRHQCPLIAGLGDGETFIAASITALGAATRRVFYPDDGEIVAATRDA